MANTETEGEHIEDRLALVLGPDEAGTRLELLIGHLADLLTPARELVTTLRLRSNASHTSREELRHLVDLSGSIWERLDAIRKDASQLSKEREC